MVLLVPRLFYNSFWNEKNQVPYCKTLHWSQLNNCTLITQLSLVMYKWNITYLLWVRIRCDLRERAPTITWGLNPACPLVWLRWSPHTWCMLLLWRLVIVLKTNRFQTWSRCLTLQIKADWNYIGRLWFSGKLSENLTVTLIYLRRDYIKI